MTKQEHIHYFDVLRIFAAVCVIYMHSAAGLLRADTVDAHWHGANLLTGLAFTAVPLFFMMSGYLLISSPRTPDVSVLLKKRLPHLLIPLLGWTIVVILWQMHLEDSFTLRAFFTKLLAALYEPASLHLWYMYALTGLYLLSPVLALGLNKLDRKGHCLILVLIGLLQCKAILQTLLPDHLDAYLEIDLLRRLNFFDGNLAVFVLGWYLGKWEKKLPKGILITGIVLLLAVIVGGTWYCKTHLGYYDQRFVNQQTGFMILLAALVFLLAKQTIHTQKQLSTSLVPLTLGVYLMQSVLLELLLAVGPAIDTFWDTLWVTALTLALCWLTLKTLATVRPLCYLATGMSYREACQSCNWVYTVKKMKEKHES